MKTCLLSVLLATALLLISISCSVPAPATPSPSSGEVPKPSGTISPGPAKTEKPSWEVEWERAIAEGKKEGKVMIYSNAGSEVRVALTESFRGKYGLDLEWVMGTGSDFVPKLEAERQAGLFLADIWLDGGTNLIMNLKPAGMLDPLSAVLLLPEVKDPNAYFDGKLPYADIERSYIFSTVLYPSNIMFFNSDLAKAEDLRSYRDVLRPQWKGKIAMGDPTRPGACFRWFSVVSTEFMDLEYMKELTKQEPVLNSNERLVVEWVARGKYAIGIGIVPDYIAEFVRVGAPIKYMVAAEGTWLTGGPGVMGLINKAPHPNAAKVFINWLLSKEGQTLYSRTNLTQSSRVDIPTEHLDPFGVRDPKKKYFNSENEDFLLRQPEFSKNAKQIFGPLVK